MLGPDEGYIKYSLSWEKAPALPDAAVQELIFYRQRLYEQSLIGFDTAQGVGFGNISRRCKAEEPGLFMVSGTQTGGISPLTSEHICVVTDFSLSTNRLHCQGPIKASSESLTHAATYELAPAYRAVIHVHHLEHWKRLQQIFPTTHPDIPYGTPQMGYEIERLYAETNLHETGFLVMGGHREGLLSFGENLEQAYQNLQDALRYG